MTEAERQPETVEVDKDSIDALADHIINVSLALDKLLSGPFNERAIVLLINELSGVKRSDIKKIFKAISELENNFFKKE